MVPRTFKPTRRLYGTRRPLPWAALFVLSACCHVVVAALVFLLSALVGQAPKQKVAVHPIALRQLDAQHWSRNRGTGPARASASAANASHRAPKPERMPAGQVVDVAPGNQQESSDAKYLAETSNRVEKQTRAEHPTPTRAQAGPVVAKPASQQSLQARSMREVAPVNRLLPHWDPALHADDGPRPVSGDKSQRASPNNTAQPTESHGETDEHGTTFRNDGSSVGGAASPDDLSGVAAGEGTFLNTREWKYAGFFNRVKQAVAAHWDPQSRQRAQGHADGPTNRTTMVQVTLGLDGRLQDIAVVQSCGLDFLDAEAVKAFERAQPFANPPEALAENGAIRFGFGFHIFNDGSTPRMFRTGRAAPGRP